MIATTAHHGADATDGSSDAPVMARHRKWSLTQIAELLD